jgi:hypothetical protein
MFGAPEKADERNRVRRAAAPVPCERELLWPADLVEILGTDLLERLYGDFVRRTRLTVLECCRRDVCVEQHIYNLLEAGELDYVDISHPDASRAEYRIYRYSLVSWFFGREFGGPVPTRTQQLSAEDLRRIERAVAARERNP